MSVSRPFPSSPGRQCISFSQERLCTWPYFESEGLWNSEVAYSFVARGEGTPKK